MEKYRYKGMIYDYPPIKYYYIDGKEYKDTYTINDIRRRIPMFVHLLIFLLLCIPNVFTIYTYTTKSSIKQEYTHRMLVPSEMYFDTRTQTLDIDIYNDASNKETISISIVDEHDNVIVTLNGIEPGYSIGGIPVTEYEFKELPMQVKVLYNAVYNGKVYSTIEKKLLIVSSVTSEDSKSSLHK